MRRQSSVKRKWEKEKEEFHALIYSTVAHVGKGDRQRASRGWRKEGSSAQSDIRGTICVRRRGDTHVWQREEGAAYRRPYRLGDSGEGRGM